MDKIEKCAVIKYLFIVGMSTKQIYDDMFVTLGDDGPSYSAVKNWVADFKRGRNNVVDKHRPKNSAIAENIQIINDMLNKDRHLTIRLIAETTSINCSIIHQIVSEDL